MKRFLIHTTLMLEKSGFKAFDVRKMLYKKAEKILFLGVERVVGCLCQCAAEEMEREREKHRAEDELLHIRQIKSAGL